MKARITVGQLSRKLGMSWQNYYKGRLERQRREVDSGLIEELVRAERTIQPRLGGIPKTTDSRHSLPVFQNLVKETELVRANQVWVADITYIRSDEGFLYLSLLMDLWSRKIVGYHGGDTLETEGAFPVHHSDRGCRYCSHWYVEKLQAHELGLGMTEEMHCYENAHSERLNGIVKQEYGLGCSFLRKKQALVAIDEAVFLYNTCRPPLSLNHETPEKMRHKIA
jgi:transposase InsO family protein